MHGITLYSHWIITEKRVIIKITMKIQRRGRRIQRNASPLEIPEKSSSALKNLKENIITNCIPVGKATYEKLQV